MIKNIFLGTLIYIALILSVILPITSELTGQKVLLTLLFTLGFVIYILREVLLMVRKELEGNNVVSYTEVFNAEADGVKPISVQPLVSIFRKYLGDDHYYFDNEYFYAVNKEGLSANYKLVNITEVSRTHVKSNKRSIWRVLISEGGLTYKFNFYHNYTLRNKNFPDFIKRLEEINPSAIKTKWTIWTR